MREVLSSLDIGSSKIKLVVAEILNGNTNILCALDEPSRGVKKGEIVNPDEVEYAIKKILKRAEENLGIKINKLLISVSENACEFSIGEAQIDITEDGEVTSTGIQKIIQQSVKGNVPQGNEIVTIIPIKYKVDDITVPNPKGAKGTSLQVKTVIVTVPKRDIYVIAKVLEKCGCEVVDVMTPSIGSFYANKDYLLSKSESLVNDNTGVIIDIGSDTINIGVINKGIIVNNKVLQIGGNLVEQDIAFIYKLDVEKAKELKEKFALANKRNANPKTNMEVVNTLGEKVVINQYEVTEVVMSRLHEILNMAKNEINYLTKKEISYIIITGGLSEFKGFTYEVESVFGPLAKIGKINIVGVRDNKYACSVGMIKYFDEKLKLRDREYSMFNQEELETLSGNGKNKNNGSVINKVFGIFFDN